MSELTLKLPAIRKIAAYTSPITLPLGLVALSKFTFAFAGVVPNTQGNALISTFSLAIGLVVGAVFAMTAED